MSSNAHRQHQIGRDQFTRPDVPCSRRTGDQERRAISVEIRESTCSNHLREDRAGPLYFRTPDGLAESTIPRLEKLRVRISIPALSHRRRFGGARCLAAMTPRSPKDVEVSLGLGIGLRIRIRRAAVLSHALEQDGALWRLFMVDDAVRVRSRWP
jgi:hypothetical protein